MADDLPQSWDAIAAYLDVIDAELETAAAERVLPLEESLREASFDYMNRNQAQYHPLVQRSLGKTNELNELPPLEFERYRPVHITFSAPFGVDERQAYTRALGLLPLERDHSIFRATSGLSARADSAPRWLYSGSTDEGPSSPGQLSFGVLSAGQGLMRKRQIEKSVRFDRSTRRRLLANYFDVPALLQAGVMCAADLSIGHMQSLVRWEVNGRHGHGANLMVTVTPALVVTVRHCPPTAWRQLPSLISVTICLAEDGTREAESSTGVNFISACSCHLCEDFRSGVRGSSAPCQHESIVMSELHCGNRLSTLGLGLKHLLQKTRSHVRETPTGRSAKVNCSALAFAISSTKIMGDIAAIYWSGADRQGGAVPVLFHLSKRLRDDAVKPEISCSRCVSDKLRPSCKHEKMCAYHPKVRGAISSEVRRIGGCAGSNVGEDIRGAEEGIDGGEELVEVGGEAEAMKFRDGCTDEDWKKTVSQAAKEIGLPIPGKPFQSYARRMPFPCLSDLEIIPERASAVRESAESNSKPPKLVDQFGQCCNLLCRAIARPLTDISAGARCVALVQWDGTHVAEVRDWFCRACGQLNRFEGLDSGCFSMTQSMIFDRRVLDWLVAYTLRDCGTGRCAYAALMDARKAAAEAHGRVVSSFGVRDPGRREFSEALSSFVSVLGDAPGNPGSLSAIFTCCLSSSLSIGDESGGMCCNDKAVAIDGTASGILAQLPSFEKDEVAIECLSSKQSSRQHLLTKLHQREGVRHLLRTAQQGERQTADLASTVLSNVLRSAAGAGATPNNSDIAEQDGSDDSSDDSESLSNDATLDLRGDDDELVPTEEKTCSRVELCKLHSKAFRSAPSTRRARCKAVLDLIEPSTSSKLRMRRSASAKSLNLRCDADCIEANPGAEEIEEEADELQELSSLVAGQALRDAFVFWDSSCGDAPPDIEANNTVEPSIAPPVSNQPSNPNSALNPEASAPDVAAKRICLDVALFASFVTLLIVLLCDPIYAVWGGFGHEGEVWLRELCLRLFDLSVSVGSVQAKASIDAVENMLRRGEGQCPSLLRFLRELCAFLRQQPEESTGETRTVCLLLAQSVARLCLLAIRQCRLFDRVSDMYASDSARAYADSNESPGYRWSLPWSVDEGKRTGHMYPGRRPTRQGVLFTGKQKKTCSKEYVASSGPSPGVIVVACVCGNKTVLGFSLLSRKESLSIIATILLVYFPWVIFIFYDAVCNLFGSIVLRFPWFTLGRHFLIDVFHKLCHTCGVTFCTSTQMEAQGAVRDPRTSNVESANNQLAGIRNSFLRTRPSNAMAILTIRFLFINLLSRWRKETGCDDTEDADLGALCNRIMQCRCGRCLASRGTPGERGEQFARDELAMHSAKTKRESTNAGFWAKGATAAAQEADEARSRNKRRTLIGDRRLIGSLGGRR